MSIEDLAREVAESDDFQRAEYRQDESDIGRLAHEVIRLRKRVTELEAALAKATKPPFATNSAIVAAEAGRLDNRYELFAALRTELSEADICLACGDHTPGRTCQCENDE